MKLMLKNVLIVVVGVLLFAGILFASIHIYENTTRERELRMESYLRLNHSNESMRLSSAINEMIHNIENSQTLRSSEKSELLTTIAFTARDMNMGVTYVDIPSGSSLPEIADTARSMVNFAGIYYHNSDFTPNRVFEALLTTGGSDPEYRWAWRYLDEVGIGTTREQFESSLMREHRVFFDRPTALQIESWTVEEAEQIIQQRLQESQRG